MVIQLVILLISLVFLLLAADWFVDSAILLARKLNVSEMIVGLTVVAIGTSLPEAAASAAAALKGHPEIALGNVIGSNIANIGLILGVPALAVPIIAKQKDVMFRQGALMLACTIVLYLFALTLGEIPRPVGAIFLIFFTLFIWGTLKRGRSKKPDPLKAQMEEVGETKLSVLKPEKVEVQQRETPEVRLGALGLRISGSLVLLLISSKYLVEATIFLARGFGISENVIAISIIALGTSLPELSVSISAARKKQGDILVGNIIGSNISNILFVLGLGASIHPLSIPAVSSALDIPLMMVFALFMLLFLSQEKGINASKGWLLLTLYAGVIVRCVLLP
jgi:cation:H+ antiporter